VHVLLRLLRFPAAEVGGQGPTDFPNIDHSQKRLSPSQLLLGKGINVIKTILDPHPRAGHTQATPHP
jgi:hypothetical protein